MAKSKKKLLETTAVVEQVTPPLAANPETTTEPQSIAKPKKFSLDKYKSKRSQTIGNLETLPSKLSVLKISDVGDFVRVHPDVQNYWTDELCFVDVPIKDTKKSVMRHLIDEELALRYLEPKKLKYCRLALAMDALGRPFLCIIPSRNLDNDFNASALKGIESAKTKWTEVVRRQGYDDYKTNFAKNSEAFGEPKWPSQTMEELIGITFEEQGRSIDTDNHPGLMRLVGDKPSLS